MRYIAAYLLLKIAGHESPTADEITKVVSSVGIEVDEDRVKLLLSELKGKDINELIAEGSGKLASVPSGGGVAAAATASGGGAAPAAAETKEEEKKEEKEESDDDMGFGLFD